MPLVRSVGDIPSQVHREDIVETVPFEEGAGGDTVHMNPVSRPRTRQQARKEAIEQSSVDECSVRRIVDESLRGFRDEIIHMISDGFRDLSVANQGPIDQNRQSDYRVQDNNQGEGNSGNGHHERPHRDSHYASGEFHRNSDRVLNIIRNWRIRFTGDTSEVSVDEFIYRVNTLTEANLRCDYDLLCEHVHILFEGKALKWFWRFHRNQGEIVWDNLCEALKRQYKDYNTDFDIKDEILRRKQRVNETFDEYYDAIMILCDRLRIPLSDYELCETIQRNLRPEVRHELLHLEITRVAQLRRAVRRHEKFVKDMSASSANKRSHQKGHVAEVVNNDIVSEKVIYDKLADDESEVCLVVRNGQCWNCDKIGHSFIDCLEPRTVFCFGCGAKNTYRPKCPNCIQKRGNVLKDVRAKKDGHPRQN